MNSLSLRWSGTERDGMRGISVSLRASPASQHVQGRCRVSSARIPSSSQRRAQLRHSAASIAITSSKPSRRRLMLARAAEMSTLPLSPKIQVDQARIASLTASDEGKTRQQVGQPFHVCLCQICTLCTIASRDCRPKRSCFSDRPKFEGCWASSVHCRRVVPCVADCLPSSCQRKGASFHGYRARGLSVQHPKRVHSGKVRPYGPSSRAA